MLVLGQDDGEQPDAEPQPQFMVEVTEASGSTGFFECVGHNDGFFEVQRAGVKPAGVSDEVPSTLPVLSST